MEKKCKVRHYFPGGNTTQGFYSYYDYILPQEEATRIICLKGGPGVGKSTFMKRIGKAMEEREYDVDYLHCSSDPDSLDGLLIPAIKVAFIDGTAPHIVDPKNPGAVDEIIHLGDYWDEDGIRQNKDQVLKVNSGIGKLFRRAYKYLKAAKSLYDDMVVIHQEAVNPAGIPIEADKFILTELDKIPLNSTLGRIRKQFASAITPDGLINYLDNLIQNYDNLYVIKGAPGTGTEKLLGKIMEAVTERGINVEAYYCPIDPEKKLEHLLIPELNIACITPNNYHTVEWDNAKVIDMNQYIDYTLLDKYEDPLAYDKEYFDAHVNQAIMTIQEAKKQHDYLETFYIPHMDFGAEYIRFEQTLERVLKYADEINR